MNGDIKTYKDLIVWQKSIELVKQVYRLTENLPKEETFGLKSQIRRAVVSIPANIAEGHKLSSSMEYVRFLTMSYGSSAELETELIICIELDYFSESMAKEVFSLLEEIQKMLSVLIRNLRQKS